MSVVQDVQKLLRPGVTASLGTTDAQQRPFVTLVSIAAAGFGRIQTVSAADLAE